MTSNLTCQLEQSEIALGINTAGWRQGSVFLPNENIELPFFFDSINQVLIVISQSCSVVSSRFDADPFVEAIAAKKIVAYNERAPEATGKNQRKLHIKLSMGKEGCNALECDINRRFSFDRKKLLELLIIQELSIENTGAKKIATWLGRYYTRIALPDELVKSMKKHLLPVLEKSLKKDSMYFEVDSIYITYESQFDTGFFNLKLLFCCKSEVIADKLDQILIEKLDCFLKLPGMDNIYLTQLICRSCREIFIADLDGYERFSECDYFTDLGELHQLIDQSSYV